MNSREINTGVSPSLSETGRPNPRPVRVDSVGRIFELTGEQIVMPGLEPEAVLEGLADFEAGRYRPLEEILANRHHEL